MTDLIALVRHQQHLAMQYGREDVAKQWGEVADALKDARRYRYLKGRAHADYAWDLHEGAMWRVGGIHDPKEQGLDAAIDAAMEGT